MKSYGVVVVGSGYWGPNLCRNFAEHPRTHLVAVVDRDRDALARAGRRWPTARLYPDLAPALERPDVDLVAVATPTDSHFGLARAALDAGRHVLIEKPMAASPDQCAELLALAGRNRRMLAVDHTFLFSGAVRCLRELVQTGQLGRVLYVESTRVNLGLYQPDCDVVWDLAPHDLAILAHVLGRPVPAVRSATASDLVVPGRPDLAHVALDYAGIPAHLTLSWLSPVKIRRMVIAGDRRMAIWDDLDNVAAVQVYECGAEAIPAGEAGRAARVEYRRGDMHAPKLDGREALAVEVDDLVGALDHWDDGCRRPPVSDGQLGLAVVRTLEEVSAAIEARR